MCGCLLLAACSGPVEVDAPDVDADDRAACEAFVDDLPATLAAKTPVETEPKDPLGAAWGDPAIVLRCGVDVPDEFDETSACEEADGVGWFAPPEQYDDQSADVTHLRGHAPARGRAADARRLPARRARGGPGRAG